MQVSLYLYCNRHNHYRWIVNFTFPSCNALIIILIIFILYFLLLLFSDFFLLKICTSKNCHALRSLLHSHLTLLQPTKHIVFSHSLIHGNIFVHPKRYHRFDERNIFKRIHSPSSTSGIFAVFRSLLSSLRFPTSRNNLPHHFCFLLLYPFKILNFYTQPEIPFLSLILFQHNLPQ